MMIADLMDLEDFIARLQPLGIATNAGDDASTVASAIDQWLAESSTDQRQQLQQLVTDVERDFAGNLLPDVKQLLTHCQQQLTA